MQSLTKLWRERQEFFHGLAFVVVAGILLVLLPSEVPKPRNTWGVINALPGGHRLFPLLGLLLCLGCGLLIMISALVKEITVKAETKAKERDIKGFWITILAWALYALMVTYIGYVISTVLLAVFLMRFYGVKSWIKILGSTAAVTLVCYLMFVVFMKVPFPHQAILF